MAEGLWPRCCGWLRFEFLGVPRMAPVCDMATSCALLLQSWFCLVGGGGASKKDSSGLYGGRCGCQGIAARRKQSLHRDQAPCPDRHSPHSQFPRHLTCPRLVQQQESPPYKQDRISNLFQVMCSGFLIGLLVRLWSQQTEADAPLYTWKIHALTHICKPASVRPQRFYLFDCISEYIQSSLSRFDPSSVLIRNSHEPKTSALSP